MRNQVNEQIIKNFQPLQILQVQKDRSVMQENMIISNKLLCYYAEMKRFDKITMKHSKLTTTSILWHNETESLTIIKLLISIQVKFQIF